MTFQLQDAYRGQIQPVLDYSSEEMQQSSASLEHKEFKGLQILTKDIWKGYRIWNQGLCEYFFSGRYQGRPVYLDLDEEVLRDVYRSAFNGKGDARKHLIKSIRDTLDLRAGVGSSPFAAHLGLGRAWGRSKFSGSPPFVALLGLFSIVAESMIASEDFAPNNYYGRLITDLSAPEVVENQLIADYRQAISELWPMLNQWLEFWEGGLGYPTARALDGRKYVSVSISQALIRDHDRLLMRRMFGEIGLVPGMRLQAAEMGSILIHWVSSGHQNTSLARLLGKGPEIRERITELACAELAAWTGMIERSSTNAPSRLKLGLVGELRMHPLPQMDLFLAPAVADASLNDAKYQLESASDGIARLAFEAAGGNVRLELIDSPDILSLEPWAHIRAGDALLAQIELRSVKSGAPSLYRNGQPICALCYSDHEGVFREVAQAPLMERLLVLAHDSVAPKVKEHLEECARPGFRVMQPSQLAGLPSRWVAFLDVQIAKRVERGGLDALVPIGDHAMVLSGGISLGHGTWLTSSPPELLVSESNVNTKRSVKLTQRLQLNRQFPETVLGDLKGVAAFDLVGLGVPDGDYSIQVVRQDRNGNNVAQGELSIRMRSSNSARPAVIVASECVRHLVSKENPRGMISAVSSSGNAAPDKDSECTQAAGALVASVTAFSTGACHRPMPDESSIGKGFEAPVLRSGGIIDTATTDSASCILRGYHYWVYDPVPAGAARGYLVRAKCNDCHIDIWQRTGGQPSRARGRGSRLAPHQSHTRQQNLTVSTMPARQEKSPSYEAIFEALNYWRAGTFTQLAGVVSCVDGSPWAAHEYARVLSSLCHLDVALDVDSLKPIRWSVSPTCLVQINAEEAVLSGWRSGELVAHLRQLTKQAGGQVTEEWAEGKFPVLSVNGLTPEKMEQLAKELSEVAGNEVNHVQHFPSRLLSGLPRLQSLSRKLPEIRTSSANLEMFNLKTAAWVPSQSADAPGAYRVRWHGATYFVVRSDQVGKRVGILADSRTAKFIAAAESGVSLVGYRQEGQELLVPFGCELPGLLERAAVMCSGRPPARKDGKVYYSGVPQSIAIEIWQRACGSN